MTPIEQDVVVQILKESPRKSMDGCYNLAFNLPTVLWFYRITEREFRAMFKKMKS